MMFDRSAVISLYIVMCGVLPAVARLGYYEGGTIFWEARDPDNPREITIDFELNFDSRKDSSTHYQCTEERIYQHKKLRTGGQFRVGDSNPVWANYYCTYLDRSRNAASGAWSMTYTLPPNNAVAAISYTECCWIPGIVNNGRDIGTGKGWNLASTINIDHGDGTINSPPKSKTFARYSIMSGCTYSIHIPSDDANNDRVKCRWTKEKKDECNSNALDICGTPYFDEERSKPVATLHKDNCTLRFGETEVIPPGTYAFMVMLEDFSPRKPKRAISKTPVHFLMDVFYYDGDCRQPLIDVPDGKCFAHVLGEEFRMRMVATATAPIYRITSIDVQGFPTDQPRRLHGTESDYFIIFSFVPNDLKMYTICAKAREDNKFVSTQSCFTVKVVPREPAALRVDRVNSIPAEGSEEAVATIPEWTIKFNRRIQKGEFGPAYVALRDTNGELIWQVDATGPDAAVVNGEDLVFPNSHEVYLEHETEYTIYLDEGVVQSDDAKCSVKSKPSEWSFVTAPAAPASEHEVACSVSSMTMYLAKLKIDLGRYGPEIMHLRDPECTGADYNETHYAIWTSYGTCGTTFQRNGTDVTYSNTVYIPQEPYWPVGTEVTRAPHTEVRFTCSLPAATIKTLEYNPNPGVILRDVVNGRADFLDSLPDTSLKLFDAHYSKTYGESAHPLDVPFDARLYFQGKAVCPGGRSCDAFFQSCWATTSENPYDWPRHELIKKGCEIDETVRLRESGVSHKVRFSVDAFAFLGWRIHDTVYVHCNVFVCNSDDYSSICKARCNRPTETFERISRRDFETVVSSPGLVRRN